MDMTVIASKQEGRTAGANIVGGAQRDSIRLLDMDFVRNKYFFSIDPEERTPSGRRKFLAGEMTAIEVYLDDGNGNNNVGEGVVEAYALLDPAQPPGETAWADSTYHGFFDVLERNRDYAVDQRTGEISLLKPLDAAHTLAVGYTYAYVDQSEQHTEVVGGKDNQDRLILKIIRPAEKYLIEQELIWGGTLKFER
jgi:hypothetical protein